jgi:hypothetical protein
MELRARLVQMLPLQTGEGKNGQWKKQDIIVETEGQYPKKVCVAIWGDKADASVLNVGNMLNISFDVESREFNGRWYTDVRAWKVEMAGAEASAPATQADTVQPVFTPSGEAKDDLPF